MVSYTTKRGVGYNAMNNFFLVFTKEQIDRKYEMIRNDPEESFLDKHYPKFEWVKGEPKMANETIEDIVRDVRHVSELHGMSYMDDKNWHLTIHNYTRILADRIEAAHKAETEEVDRLRAGLKSVMKEYCSRNCDVEFGSESCRGSQCRMSEALATEGGAK